MHLADRRWYSLPANIRLQAYLFLLKLEVHMPYGDDFRVMTLLNPQLLQSRGTIIDIWPETRSVLRKTGSHITGRKKPLRLINEHICLSVAQ